MVQTIYLQNLSGQNLSLSIGMFIKVGQRKQVSCFYSLDDLMKIEDISSLLHSGGLKIVTTGFYAEDPVIDTKEQVIELIDEYGGINQFATVLYASSQDGSDVDGDGSLSRPFRTIRKVLEVYEGIIITSNWYLMRVVHILSGFYPENVIVPPGRFTLFSENAIIDGSLTFRRNATMQSSAKDPITGGHTSRMKHTVRLDGGMGFDGVDYDGGIMFTGGVMCSYSSDIGTANLDVFARNAVIEGGLTPNEDFGNPHRDHGDINLHLECCHINGEIHSPLLNTLSINLVDTKISANIKSHPFGLATFGKVKFLNMRDSFVSDISLGSGDIQLETNTTWNNVQFSTVTMIVSSLPVTIELDSNSYASLMKSNPFLSNVNFLLIDNADGTSYFPGTPGDWVNPLPSTVKEALDRIASVLGPIA